MKRLFSLFLTAVIALLLVACVAQDASENTGKEPTKEHNDIITEAISELREGWKEEYAQSKIETDGHFEIKNTRIITLKNNDIELFENVQYIIEFDLYTDYMGSAPYYENCGLYNNVVVYKNGTMEVTSNLIRAYRSKTYQADYSGFIEAIDDYNGRYNCIEKLK